MVEDLNGDCILGTDFINKHQLPIHRGANKITYPYQDGVNTIQFLPTEDSWQCNITIEQPFDLSHLSIDEQQQLNTVLDKYEALFTSDPTKLGQAQSIEHRIETDNIPIYAEPYRSIIAAKAHRRRTNKKNVRQRCHHRQPKSVQRTTSEGAKEGWGKTILH